MDVVCDREDVTFLSSAAEQDIKVYQTMAGISRFVASFVWSAQALTQATTFRMYGRIDGATWQLFDGTGLVGGLVNWVVGNGRILRFNVNSVVDFPLKITAQSTLLLEGASRVIPVSVGYIAG
jgi:hypothetical protein